MKLGGIVGEYFVNANGNDTIAVTNCVNNATLLQATDIGGIAGHVSYENGIAMIEGCENNGFLDCYFCAGGITEPPICLRH